MKKIGIRTALRTTLNVVRCAGKQKIFCIGRNKTGTTSLARALRDLGIIVGYQTPAELLIHDWAQRDFRRIVRYCLTAQAFQDVPFSLPYTFQALDKAFPGAKFILTVRDSPEQWYSSAIRFQSKMFGHGEIPNGDDLRKAAYRYPGWAWDTHRAIHWTPSDDLYNREKMIEHYNFHNQTVLEYFRHRPNDLLVINLAEKGSYAKFCEFIGKQPVGKDFPWENKTADLKVRS